MKRRAASEPTDTDRSLRVVGCTVVAQNYLPYAQVVGDGWAHFHPACPFAVLVIDDDAGRAPEGRRRFLAPSTIGVSAQELDRLRGIYGAAELTCALKPHLIRFLLGEEADAVVYVDSDTDIRGSMRDVAELAADWGVALSPNVLKPIPLDGQSPSELEMARVGIYSSGFIAVGRGGWEFLDWWTNHARWDCLLAENGGLHADQRWLDWVPLYFDHAVIRDDTLNVAYWNLHERRLALADGGFTLNDKPLRSFHFSGFDPLRPDRLTGYPLPVPWRADLDDTSLAHLCQQYAAKLLSVGYQESHSIPYRYGRSASGCQLGWWERKVYREALLAAESRGGDAVPSPFDRSRAGEFADLLTNPRSIGLLSENAITRLEDSRVVMNGGGWDRRRVTDALRSRLARGLRVSRPPWMPNPLPADRTRTEYGHVGR